MIKRHKFRQWFSEAAGRQLVSGLFTAAERIADPVNSPRHSRDPSDDYLVELAFQAGAELVSVDRDLLEIEDPPIPISRPGRFLDRLVSGT